jgi:hypothetical protein
MEEDDASIFKVSELINYQMLLGLLGRSKEKNITRLGQS